MNFTLRFEMDSDWHVGAGFGRPGNVDRLLVRDPDELPYLPAKTVRGMRRDAAERLARGLDEGKQHGPWQQLVDGIFGSQPQLGKSDPSGYHTKPEDAPRETVLNVTPARLPAGLRAKLSTRALRAAVSFVKPGVAIDEETGRAKDDFLRFEEMGRAGTVLTATATFAGGDAAKHLMLAATRLITRVGGKRRRGAGKCTVTVIGKDVSAAIGFLEYTKDCPTLTKPQNTHAAVTIPAAAGGDWVSVPLRLELVGPVAVPARTVGNVVESLDFVPGTFLLPHVTKFLEDHKVNARGAIARGDVRVLNATLEANAGRGLPVPMHLFAEKGEKFPRAVNRFLDPNDDDQWKQLREGYAANGEHGTVTKVIRTHNVVEDKSQRPTTEVGGVYSFEAIAPRTVLRGELRVRKGLVPANFDWKQLSGAVRLGVSKKDDYGGAMLDVGDVADHQPKPSPNADLFVWLLSDVLLRGVGGQPDPTVGSLARTLEMQLGREEKSLAVVKQFVRLRRTESWHTGWGLPRPSLVGLQAGSCVQFKVVGVLDPNTLAKVEASGIGERTAEGFGHVSFNHDLLAKHKTTKEWKDAVGSVPPAPPPRPHVLAGAIDPTTATHIELAAWREAVKLAALSAVAAKEQRKKLFAWESSKPNMSQLGGLRAAVQFLKSDADRERVGAWLEAVKKNRRRGDKWPRGSLDDLKTLVEKPARVWAILRDVPSIEWPVFASAQSDLETTLWAFAVRALIDAAVRAHKREGEK